MARTSTSPPFFTITWERFTPPPVLWAPNALIKESLGSERKPYLISYFAFHFDRLFALSAPKPHTSYPVFLRVSYSSRKPQACFVQPGVLAFGNMKKTTPVFATRSRSRTNFPSSVSSSRSPGTMSPTAKFLRLSAPTFAFFRLDRPDFVSPFCSTVSSAATASFCSSSPTSASPPTSIFSTLSPSSAASGSFSEDSSESCFPVPSFLAAVPFFSGTSPVSPPSSSLDSSPPSPLSSSTLTPSSSFFKFPFASTFPFPFPSPSTFTLSSTPALTSSPAPSSSTFFFLPTLAFFTSTETLTTPGLSAKRLLRRGSISQTIPLLEKIKNNIYFSAHPKQCLQ
mmetsp:Transcript_9828/g.20018  ORF Transcript_9828/g.20018 Transcript_9828/m.20018 type:complete len:340 (-) Transcript_9828:61-1080(-)